MRKCRSLMSIVSLCHDQFLWYHVLSCLSSESDKLTITSRYDMMYSLSLSLINSRLHLTFALFPGIIFSRKYSFIAF
jgi:hypothetical protein